MRNYFKNMRVYVGTVWDAAPATFFFYIATIVASVALPFYISKIQSDIIDGIITAVKNSTVITAALTGLVITYALAQLASGINGSLRTIFGSSGRYQFQTAFEFRLLKQFISLDIGRYQDPDFKKLLQKGIDGGNQWSIDRLGSFTFGNFLPSLVKISIATSIVLFFDWKIFLVIIFAEVPPIINRLLFDRAEYSIWAKRETETQMRYFDLRGHIRGINSLTELKIYQIGEYFLKRIKGMYDSTVGAVHEYEQKRLAINIFADFVSAAAYGWAIYATILHALAGDITVGHMTFIFGTIFSAGSAVSTMLYAIADMAEQNRYATHVREFLEIEPILKTENPQTISIDKAPVIEFKNVSFKYPKQSAEMTGNILSNISLTIRPGEKIGLIGDNGAGKSTFIKLLLRIYDPSEGSILVNGIDLKNIPPDLWQTHISALMQDYSTYNFKVNEAIAVSQNPEQIDNDRVLQASAQAQSFKFIDKLGHGYDAQIGTDFGGVKFSGGQNQKMALARTFYRKAPIVILDEPTAAIDTESEIEIFKTLDSLGENTTAIFISHDMATIGRAERIIVLEKGEVIEDGNHAKLMNHAEGKYRRMYEEQVKAMVR